MLLLLLRLALLLFLQRLLVRLLLPERQEDVAKEHNVGGEHGRQGGVRGLACRQNTPIPHPPFQRWFKVIKYVEIGAMATSSAKIMSLTSTPLESAGNTL